MRRLLWTLAPVALGATLALSAASAQSPPLGAFGLRSEPRLRLPELLLPTPGHALPRKGSAAAEKRGKRSTDLGDYTLPGQAPGAKGRLAASARAAARS